MRLLLRNMHAVHLIMTKHTAPRSPQHTIITPPMHAYIHQPSPLSTSLIRSSSRRVFCPVFIELFWFFACGFRILISSLITTTLLAEAVPPYPPFPSRGGVASRETDIVTIICVYSFQTRQNQPVNVEGTQTWGSGGSSEQGFSFVVM